MGFITEKQLKLFEIKKKRLEQAIANGFEWPSAFRCGNLKYNVGTKGIEELQKLAWLRHVSGEIPDEFIEVVNGERQIIQGKREQLEQYMDDNFVPTCLSQNADRYFEKCLDELKSFFNWQAFKKIESQAQKANEQLQAIYDSLKAVSSNLQLPQLCTIDNQFEIALHQIKSIERDANIAKTLNNNHAEIMQAHKHTHDKVESVPITVYENQTEEGRASLQSRGMLTGIRSTTEEMAVFRAYFNDGINTRSQNEVSQITRLSVNQVRRRAVSLNTKAGRELIMWNRTPERGKGYETDLEQNRKWTAEEHRKRHETE
jgi:hypothetical protein